MTFYLDLAIGVMQKANKQQGQVESKSSSSLGWLWGILGGLAVATGVFALL